MEKPQYLYEKYLKEGEELLDATMVEVSEKFWRATIEFFKAIAEKRGEHIGNVKDVWKHIENNKDVWEFVEKLDKENPSQNFMTGFLNAHGLHIFASKMEPRDALWHIRVVEKFLEKIGLPYNNAMGKQKNLSKKYFEKGKELLETGIMQASEKFWLATVEVFKAIAAKRGEHIEDQEKVWEFVKKLDEENPCQGFLGFFLIARGLHYHSLKNCLDREDAIEHIEIVKEFVKEMEKFLEG